MRRGIRFETRKRREKREREEEREKITQRRRVRGGRAEKNKKKKEGGASPAPTELHYGPEDGVEEELEGAFGLGAVLDAETEHDNFSFAALERDYGGFALEAFCAVGVARDQDVFGVVGIPGDDAALDVGCWRRGLEGDGGIYEGGDFVGHARCYRVIRVEIDAEESAGDVEIRRGD